MNPNTSSSYPTGGLLAVNSGSSSIKFALFERGSRMNKVLAGRIEGIGTSDAVFSLSEYLACEESWHGVVAKNHIAAAGIIIGSIKEYADAGRIGAVAHRVVYGGPKYQSHRLITADVLEELRRLQLLDPDHLPAEIFLIETFQVRFPGLPQVACFDTIFHHDLPHIAQLIAIPHRYHAKGVRRYGFHGISYEYLMEELARVAGARAACGRIILAHLGGGSSLVAVKDGKSVDTSMGFTPAGGLPMETRSGDLDPGLMRYLAQTEGFDAERFNRFVNTQCGLLGMSESSGDMRELLRRETDDFRAADAVAFYCYQVRKWIGAFAAVLGGIDTLVFSGGIGEHSAKIRSRICSGLEFLGVALDQSKNAADAGSISDAGARVAVRVLPTDEELMMARSARRILGWDPVQEIVL